MPTIAATEKNKSWSSYFHDSWQVTFLHNTFITVTNTGERGGSVVECRTPEREVGGSKPTAAVLCPWARHFTPRKYWSITQEAVAPSRHDWKIVDWDVKPQHKQTNEWFWLWRKRRRGANNNVVASAGSPFKIAQLT